MLTAFADCLCCLLGLTAAAECLCLLYMKLFLTAYADADCSGDILIWVGYCRNDTPVPNNSIKILLDFSLLEVLMLTADAYCWC